jgi:anthranilate phosphoribosyltransferase
MRTIFNLLGPLVNPARPSIMMVGVYDPALCRVLAESLRRLGCERALVVHGQGLDEIALHGPTVAVELAEGKLFERRFHPADFGAAEYPLSELTGGSPADNVLAIRDLLMGRGHDAHTAAVAVNAAALLHLSGIAHSLADGFQQARHVLSTGRAWARLQRCAAQTEGDG